MIGYLDVTYTDPASGDHGYTPGWDGSLSREPEPLDPATEHQLRAHARAALARVFPPETADDYDLEIRCRTAITTPKLAS